MSAKAAERRTLAILVDYMNLFAGGYEMELRELFEREAQRHDVNLMFVYGRAVAHPDPGYAAHNRIYELLGPRRVDGLIALSSSISSFCGSDVARDFFARYESLARCSLGLTLPSTPSIAIDNRTGMDSLLEHLLVHHGCRRIAFIAGPTQNAEAIVRFESYQRALRRHGVPFDEQLVETGDFARRSGQRAMEQILARCGRPDAIAACNDSMALGATTALRAHGLRVPQDVPVSGFDDLLIARLGDPPLTTVSQPIDAMVRLAVELVLEQLEGRAVPAVTELETRLITRESCGCRGGPLRPSEAAAQPAQSRSRERIAARALELRRALLAGEGAARADDADELALLTALTHERGTLRDRFVQQLEDVLADGSSSNDRYQRLQFTITRLRDAFADVVTPELEDLWHYARNSVALTNTRRQEQLRLEQDQVIHRLIENGERFGTALDLATLQPALTGALLTLGIGHAYISRYTDASERELECFVAVRDGAPYQPPQPRFAAEELMPPGRYPTSRRSTLLVFPLAFDAQNLGVAVFEARDGISGYQIVRDQISAVLRSIALHQEILQQTTLHERRIQEQERQATAKRIQSLSVLAGGVAHDLNNVLGPLVALPDVMAEELQPAMDVLGSAAQELRADLETIKVSALRAAQTIKDLLTLGRQGHTSKEPIDLNESLSGLLGSSELRGREQLRVSLSAEPLFVLASEAHLVRAVANLLRNALEAIDADGQVILQTSPAVLREPCVGYEVIKPGSYAVVRVSDSGRGIAAQDIGRVFEPFFSNKRLSDSGGSGLGLAIVHGVVKEHGGFINVESALGRGTTFTLYLPRCPAIRASAPALAEAPVGQGKILLIDDEIVQLRTCKRVLTQLGYRVETSSSGRQAYELIVREKARADREGRTDSGYDLVIVDMLLDEAEDGLEVFDKVRALFPTQKAIVVSGHAPGQRLELAIEQGLTWLAKPYTRATLARAVHAALRSSAPLITRGDEDSGA